VKTLAIETSCDDTSLAIVSFDWTIFSVEKMLAYTQTTEHAQRGGVVPELSARIHADKILVVLEELWGEALRDEIDFISVTSHPGLPGALIVGITTAYSLSDLRKKPVVEVNHIMGHVFSILIDRKTSILQLPYLCLTVSGGHNDLYLVEDEESMTDDDIWLWGNEERVSKDTLQASEIVSEKAHTKYQHIAVWDNLEVWPYRITKLGQTIDDAGGEAFDKVARMLWGPYPGGKRVSDVAAWGKANEQIDLHAATLPDQPLNFSFSGIKSQVHNLVESWKLDMQDDTVKADIAWRFQEEVTRNLADKLALAADKYFPKTIGIVGGVSANTRLREEVASHPDLFDQMLRVPKTFAYCTDNAAMIGVVGLLMNTE